MNTVQIQSDLRKREDLKSSTSNNSIDKNDEEYEMVEALRAEERVKLEQRKQEAIAKAAEVRERAKQRVEQAKKNIEQTQVVAPEADAPTLVRSSDTTILSDIDRKKSHHPPPSLSPRLWESLSVRLFASLLFRIRHYNSTHQCIREPYI